MNKLYNTIIFFYISYISFLSIPIIHYGTKDINSRDHIKYKLFVINILLVIINSFYVTKYITFFKVNTLYKSYSLILLTLYITYFVSVDVIGYIAYKKFDEGLVNKLYDLLKNLEDLRSKGHLHYETFVSSYYDIEPILKSNNANLQIIIDSYLQNLSRRRINNNEYKILNQNINQTINQVNNRSKHPFPVIIEITKLIGIGFIVSLLLGVFSIKSV